MMNLKQMKNRRQHILLSGVTASLLFTSVAGATETRVRARSGSFIADETEIYSFPSLAIGKQFFLAELGNSNLSEAYAATNILPDRDSAIGFTVSRDAYIYESSSLLSTAWLNGLYDVNVNGTANEAGIFSRPENNFEIVYGRKVGVNGNLGIIFGNAEKVDESSTDNQGKASKESTQTHIMIGYGRGNWNASLLTYLIRSYTTSSEAGQTKTEETYDESLKSQKLNLRYMLSPKTKILASYKQASPKAVFKSGGVDRSLNFSESRLSLGVDHAVVQNAQAGITMGATYLIEESEGPYFNTQTNGGRSILISDRKSSRSLNALSAKIGFDIDAGLWGIHLLGGLNYNLLGTETTKNKTNIDTVKTKKSVNQIPDQNLYSLGLSYVGEKLRIDATYQRSFLYTGTYLISGDNRGGNNPLFARLAMIYKI